MTNIDLTNYDLKIRFTRFLEDMFVHVRGSGKDFYTYFDPNQGNKDRFSQDHTEYAFLREHLPELEGLYPLITDVVFSRMMKDFHDNNFIHYMPREVNENQYEYDYQTREILSLLADNLLTNMSEQKESFIAKQAESPNSKNERLAQSSQEIFDRLEKAGFQIVGGSKGIAFDPAQGLIAGNVYTKSGDLLSMSVDPQNKDFITFRDSSGGRFLVENNEMELGATANLNAEQTLLLTTYKREGVANDAAVANEIPNQTDGDFFSNLAQTSTPLNYSDFTGESSQDAEGSENSEQEIDPTSNKPKQSAKNKFFARLKIGKKFKQGNSGGLRVPEPLAAQNNIQSDNYHPQTEQRAMNNPSGTGTVESETKAQEAQAAQAKQNRVTEDGLRKRQQQLAMQNLQREQQKKTQQKENQKRQQETSARTKTSQQSKMGKRAMVGAGAGIGGLISLAATNAIYNVVIA